MTDMFFQTLGLELKYRHHAPAVRTSVIILSFTKTPLFKGETTGNPFLLPLLHVDSVGDAIVDTLYRGYGRTIFMPGLLRYTALVVSHYFLLMLFIRSKSEVRFQQRGAPDWLQHVFRNGTEGLKVEFRGRQAVDPKTNRLKEA